MNPTIILLLILLHILLLPVTSLFYIFSSQSKIGRYMSQPAIKFISHFASYLIFIGMIITTYFQYSLEEENGEDKNFNTHFKNYSKDLEEYSKRTDILIHLDFNDFVMRQHQPNRLDIIISIWIIGNLNNIFY